MKNNKPRSRTKGGDKSIPTPRVPRNYFWDVLASCHNDVRDYLDDNSNRRVSDIIRSRNVCDYMNLSEDWSPQCTANSGLSLVEFRTKYLISALLKKVPFDTGLDRKSAALEKFHATESICRDYNKFNYKSLSVTSDDETCNIYTYALSFIQKVLGELPSQRDLIWSRHGPGASLDTTNGCVSQYNKFADWPYSVSSRAFRHGINLLNNDERWIGALEDDFRRYYDIDVCRILNRHCFHRNIMYETDFNKVTTVPKSYKTDRTIAIEPTINLFLQLGVDGYVRRRLKRWDINLNDQTKNQKLARKASIDGSFSTIDLSSASDSIALKLCEQLLPKPWYDYLLDLRSPFGIVGNEEIVYEKISSMGNGYTFVLESLIFASLLHGVLVEMRSPYSIRDCAVYGDDLIVPTDCVPILTRIFATTGFSLNQEKSFSSGPFRESCGADWYKGAPVRPVFLKRFPLSISDLFLDYNRLKRLFSLWYPEVTSPNSLSYILKHIPHNFRLWGPLSDDEFDTYLHSRTHKTRFVRGMWRYKTLRWSIHKRSASNFGFRKLMNYLRVSDESSDAGNTFVVSKRNAGHYTLNNSAASIWQEEYAPFITPGFSRRN